MIIYDDDTQELLYMVQYVVKVWPAPRARPAESASTGSQGLTQKSPTTISRMDTIYLLVKTPLKILKTLGGDSFCVLKFSQKLVLRYGRVYVILTVNWL